VTFHDLRGTAVTRLAIVGWTEAEIATLTGCSPQDMRMGFMPTMYAVTQHPLATREARRQISQMLSQMSQLFCFVLFEKLGKVSEINWLGGQGFEPRLTESVNEAAWRRL